MQQTGLPSDEYTQYSHWGEILCVSFLNIPDLLWCFLAVPMIVVWDEALLKTQSASWHTLANYSAYRLRRQRLPISSEIAPLAE